MKQLVIFDLDGTLINSIGDIANATNHALTRLGYPTHDVKRYTEMVGNGVTRLIERALPHEARSANIVDKAVRYFVEYYDGHNTESSIPYPGIRELLSSLAEQGVKLAVASNKYQEAVAHIITHFFPEIPWAALEGNRVGLPTKPDPSIVFQILSKVPTPKADVLYVGDSGVDMETARRACVESVGVTWGYRPYKELREYYAGHIVSDPKEILNIVNNPSF